MWQEIAIGTMKRSLFCLRWSQKQDEMHTYPGSFPKETTESVIRDYGVKSEKNKIITINNVDMFPSLSYVCSELLGYRSFKANEKMRTKF